MKQPRSVTTGGKLLWSILVKGTQNCMFFPTSLCGVLVFVCMYVRAVARVASLYIASISHVAQQSKRASFIYIISLQGICVGNFIINAGNVTLDFRRIGLKKVNPGSLPQCWRQVPDVINEDEVGGRWIKWHHEIASKAKLRMWHGARILIFMTRPFYRIYFKTKKYSTCPLHSFFFRCCGLNVWRFCRWMHKQTAHFSVMIVTFQKQVANGQRLPLSAGDARGRHVFWWWSRRVRVVDRWGVLFAALLCSQVTPWGFLRVFTMGFWDSSNFKSQLAG